MVSKFSAFTMQSKYPALRLTINVICTQLYYNESKSVCVFVRPFFLGVTSPPKDCQSVHPCVRLSVWYEREAAKGRLFASLYNKHELCKKKMTK